MKEKITLTVYIEGLSYQLAVTNDDNARETLYEVMTDGNTLRDFAIDEVRPIIDEKMIRPEERVWLVEQEQIARIIWTDIIDNMNM